MSLENFGWNAEWAAAFAPHAEAGHKPARVVCELRRKFYAVQDADKEWLGECRGGFFHRHAETSAFPAVGDWVAIEHREDGQRVDIHAVLPRRTKFSRRASGEEQIEQVLAANVDYALLVSGLDRNYNPARIQRFVVAARESKAEPVIVLNKADVVDNAPEIKTELAKLVPGVRVLLTSTVNREGLAPLRALAQPGITLALLGSSGVGKSSLVNALTSDAGLPVGEVRAKDSKGRHTTTRRELVPTIGGALLIDTPGLRELQLWEAADGVNEAFADVIALTEQCRFANCKHTNELGCAIQHALTEGTLDTQRYAHFKKLRGAYALKPAARKSNRTVANQPGWRRRVNEPKRGGRRIHPEDT